MTMKRLAIGIAVILLLNVPARGALYEIDNPASNTYNPATRMNNPNPLSPPTRPVPQPAVREVTVPTEPAKLIKEQPRPKAPIPNAIISKPPTACKGS
jgi:hypothetical protein